MFENFKQHKSFLTRAKEKTNFKYVVVFDENGAYLEVCDTKLKPISNIDYRVFNGLDREILQLIEQINQENFFEISWEDDTNKIYLQDNPRLVELLRQSNKVYDQNNIQLEFLNSVKTIDLHFTSQEDKYLAFIAVDGIENFKFLTSSYILIENQIQQIRDIGENYLNIREFDTLISYDKIEELLTILVTHFDNININFKNFFVENNAEKKVIKPAVIIEKITQNNELVFKTSATISNLNADFFNNFNITKIALLNEFENKIIIYECDFSDVFELYGTIFKNLNSLKRNLGGVFSEEDGLFIVDETIAGKFIEQNLEYIIKKAELFGSENLKTYKYNTSKASLNISFKDKIDYLGLDDVTINIDQDKFKLFDLIALYKKHSYIPLSNGEKSIIDKEYINKLERIFKKAKENIKVSFFDLPEIEELIDTSLNSNKNTKDIFAKSKKFYAGFNALESIETQLPKLNNVTLRDYQKYGVRWLKYLYDNNFGGCLADDMGLGKTLQAITLLSYIYPSTQKPSLVVMPKSLLQNWINELKTFNPNLTFYLYYENQRDIEQFNNYNIILTTYAIVRNDIEKLKEHTFDTIILDESQNIKNIDSKISKAVMLLKAQHKFTLSGTPIENNLFELYSLFRFINRGLFNSIADFKRDFVIPIQNESNENTAQILKAKISPFLLRRVKQDVLKDLPPKQEQVVYIDMDKEHKKFYNQKRDYYRDILTQKIKQNGIESSRFDILSAFNDLRQIASAPELKSDNQIKSSKIDSLFDLLEDIIANNHKVLIFANFLGSLDLISSKANELGIEHLLMTGSTKNRQELVDKFNKDNSIKLFLMTLKVGGVGLNLTSADYVFIFDPWWNKAAQNQAIDRAHRMGQQNTVFAYEMITKDTIEEKILELQTKKQDITDLIISGDEGGLKKLTQNDLEYILG